MLARFSAAVGVFLVWALSLILLVAILGLGYELVMVVIVRALAWDRYGARFTHLLYYVLAGIVSLLFVFLASDYFQRMARQGRLFLATLKTIGFELALMAVMQFVLTLSGYFPPDWLNIGLLAMSGALGPGMLAWARRKGRHIHRPSTDRLTGPEAKSRENR